MRMKEERFQSKMSVCLETFIKLIKIINLLLVFISIPIGLYIETRLIIRIFIVQGYYRDPIIWCLFGIFLIGTGIIGLLSEFFIVKSKFLRIQLSMLSFIILSGNCLFMAIFTFVFKLSRELSSLHHLALSINFLLYSVISFVSIFFLFKIYKNKEVLKEHVSIKTCYNCGAEFKFSFEYCPNCGVKQRSDKTKHY